MRKKSISLIPENKFYWKKKRSLFKNQNKKTNVYSRINNLTKIYSFYERKKKKNENNKIKNV